MYNSFNSELLAISAGLQHWRQLLVGAQLTVFTDHRPAIHHLTKRQLKTMSALCYKITSFDCDIQHIVGEENFIADYLSRNINDDITDNDDKNDTNVPETDTDQELTDGIKSLSLNVQKSKQTGRAGTKTPAEKTEQVQTEDSADEQDDNQNKTNNKQLTVIIDNSKKLSNPRKSEEIPMDSRTRQALLAKEHRHLGLVGSNNRLQAKGIASAGIVDTSSRQLWIQSQLEDPVTGALIKYLTTKQRPIEAVSYTHLTLPTKA